MAATLSGIPDRGSDVNHSGYGNASSADSWSEGFAEFWSTMVEKYIVGNPDPELYRWVGGTLDFSDPWKAWNDEESAVASVLYAIEALSLTPEPVPPRVKRTFETRGYTEVTDRTFGRLIVGRLVNTTPGGTSYGTTAGAIFYDANKRPIDASYGTTIPPDIGPGGQGLFVLAVPKNITYKDLAIVAFEGRPKPPPPAGTPFDVTLSQLMAAIVNFHNAKPLSSGHTYDVDDLYQAMKANFGGQGDIVDDLDTIDQLFVRAGFFDDSDGDFAYEPGATLGLTSHPAFGNQEVCGQQPTAGCSVDRRPRTDYTGGPAQRATVSITGADNTAIAGAQVVAQVIYPAPNQDRSYGYLVTPDAGGSVSLTVPPPTSGATVVLIAIADGHDPAVLGSLDAAQFWADATKAGGTSFLSFSATLQPGDFSIPTGAAAPIAASPSSAKGGTSATSIFILIGGLLLGAVVGIAFGKRRHRGA